MVVIDWLQTFEFVRVNSERFILYGLCGCLTGISIILFVMLIVLYIEKHSKTPVDHPVPETDAECIEKLSRLPIYRYNGRTHHDVQTTNGI